MQDHRQAVFARQQELLAVKMLLALAQRALCQGRHKIIEADFAHRNQPGVGFSQGKFGVEQGQVTLLRLADKQRVNAQRITVPKIVRQCPYGRKVSHPDRRQNAMRHAGGRCPCPHGNTVPVEVLGIEVAMGIYPAGHIPIMPDRPPAAMTPRMPEEYAGLRQT